MISVDLYEMKMICMKCLNQPELESPSKEIRSSENRLPDETDDYLTGGQMFVVERMTI